MCRRLAVHLALVTNVVLSSQVHPQTSRCHHITRVTCCGTLVYRPGRNKIPRPRFEPRGSIFPEEGISRCERGLWDEGNPGLLSGRKKNKSRGGVPALGFNPHHLRRTEERKSVPEGPAWTPRWSPNHVKIDCLSGPELEQ